MVPILTVVGFVFALCLMLGARGLGRGLPRSTLKHGRLSATLSSSPKSGTISAPSLPAAAPSHPAYSIVETSVIDEYGVLAALYEHKKTGAQVMSVLAPSDENKVFGITLRTPPSDSTGVPHILEHSVLCGSRKFPVKEPFVDLLKGSLQNFLNAFTYPDRTCYPVASTNVKDFYNLVHVYLDAVLHPRAVSDPQVLKQEGWHYELENSNDPLTYKGVVYNEMKGVYSSPDSLLGRATQRALFPDNTYGVDSGGDPLDIPKLTFDQFKAFHASFYHPSNSRVFFYGDDDPITRLNLLDEYLREFDRITVDSSVKYQPKNMKSPSKISLGFPIGPGTVPKNTITVNWLLNDKPLSAKETLALSLLDSLLLGTSSAILRKALTESQLGESVTGGGLSDELLQATFSVGLKGVNAADAQKVEALVLSKLSQIADEGFEQTAIDAALNTLEFRLREFNTGSFPRGLSLMLGMMSNWIYEKSPSDAVRFEAPLQELKDDLLAQKPVFQDLLRKFIVNNSHRVTVEMKPDAELEKRVKEDEENRLRLIKETLSESDVLEIIESTRKLKEAQAAEDSPEAKATLPRLSLSDIDRKARELPIQIVPSLDTRPGVTILEHAFPSTAGILYADIGFDFSSLSHEDLAILPLFSRMVMESGTSSMDETTLQRRIGAETGGISTSLYSDVKATGGVVSDCGPEDSILYFMVRGKAVSGRVPALFDLSAEVLLNANLDNQKRAVEMLKESKVRKETSVITSGHTFASTRLAARYSFMGYLGEVTGGLTSVRAAPSLLEQAEKDWPTLSARLVKIRDTIMRKSKVIVNLTGDEKALSAAKAVIDSNFLSKFPAGPAGAPSNNLAATWKKENYLLASAPQAEGFAVPSQVNYVVKGGPIFKPGDRVSGSASVVSRYMSLHYLWDNVRVMGGAYGGFARFSDTSGRFVYMSYRDPNLKATLDIYDKGHEVLLATDVTEEDILQGVIGSIGDLDGPMSPDQKGFASLGQFLSGEAAADRQKYRDELLGTTAKDFKAFAERLKAVTDSGVAIVFGSQAALEEANAALPEGKKLKIETAVQGRKEGTM